MTAKEKRILKKRIKRCARMCLPYAIIIVVFLVSLLGIKLYAKAEAHKNSMWTYCPEGQTVVYTSVEIHYGDTLTSISNEMKKEKNMDVPTSVLIHNICQINHIYNRDKIVSNHYVIVPYYMDIEEDL